MNEMWADLHLHSTFSDGSLSIQEIVKLAGRLGINALSITDHDTFAGQSEAALAGEKYGVKIISGIEISAASQKTGRKVHILGYGVKDTEAVEKACRPYLMSRHQASLDRIELINKAGYPIDIDIVLEYAGAQKIIYRQHIIHALADRGYTTTIYGGLYKHCFGKGGFAEIKSDCIDACEAVELVKSAGGFSVLAHPFAYSSMDIIQDLKEAGLDGIEYSHPTNNKHKQYMIENIAQRYNLFLTGGSDSHGLYTENPCVPGCCGIMIDENHILYEVAR